VALPFGAARTAYLAMAGWMTATLAFHLVRYAWVLLTDGPTRYRNRRRDRDAAAP